jgi:hypothetical protein
LIAARGGKKSTIADQDAKPGMDKLPEREASREENGYAALSRRGVG